MSCGCSAISGLSGVTCGHPRYMPVLLTWGFRAAHTLRRGAPGWRPQRGCLPRGLASTRGSSTHCSCSHTCIEDTCAHTCTHSCTCTLTWRHIYNVLTFAHIPIDIHVCLHMHILTHVHSHTFTHVITFSHIHKCTHRHKHIGICPHAHLHHTHSYTSHSVIAETQRE